MIPYATDPSLHATQPPPAQLEDGFSPPGQALTAAGPEGLADAAQIAPAPLAHSLF